MHKYILPAFVAGLLVLTAGCKEEKIGPISNDVAPAPVSNVTVENLPGGARISYALPKDKNLLYVKATYQIREGVEKEAKASLYESEIHVEGFPDTREYEVQLYSVSRGEHMSVPVSARIQPLTSPIEMVYKSLSFNATFGGMNVKFRNETGANVVLTILTPDSSNELAPAETYYTKSPEGSFAARGFTPVERTFGVFVKDRWNNHSDTAFVKLTPIFEEKLDKKKFREIHLATDTYEKHVGRGMIDLWDDVWNNSGNMFHTKPNTGIPQWFTFDLGVKARLSRFKFYHRAGGTSGAYYAGDAEIMEVWGSNDPASDGSWDSWALLAVCNSRKPSGAATPTAEDLQFAAVDGEDFEFPPDIPAVRYLRFKVTKVWGGVSYIYISELTFWGKQE